MSKIYQNHIQDNSPVRFIASCRLPTQWGEFTMHGFEDVRNRQEHIALTVGDISTGEDILGRIHSECLTGDALFSKRCDCGPQLEAAMKAVQEAGKGVIIYLRQEGRGIGLLNKIRAYKLQDEGLDTVEANLALNLPIDARDFSLAKHILDHLGIQSVQLMTNNPQKVDTLKALGIHVTNRVPLHVGQNPENRHYLHTKMEKLGHFAD
ncbi:MULTISPECIES: GTP cyclohydrolase II [Snodgrassella]|uniref:GTP cyclohydrolase II n=1 Tax=Snodgrassella TaxID=1193515 RepID=UPI000D7832B9|nr:MULTISPECIES: GTP cyclohydrolase II [Snodgrassella]MBI0097147.1 GTP cyclohydrolase II [Snodgrassella sp. W8134]MBI0101120.1 GTP cyclohydrolase II [Snodgrassella sp. W8135]MBI0181960.1 GTP cyclohydrolase II [Snodgrassella sp. W8158]PXY97655.1 GTP cyclohydrolase II [Snodgrassella alvi]